MKIKYTNYRKKYPNTGAFPDWKFYAYKHQSGKIWTFRIHGHTLQFDFRGGPKQIFANLIGNNS